MAAVHFAGSITMLPAITNMTPPSVFGRTMLPRHLGGGWQEPLAARSR
jgi:hypothetical protein